MQKKRFPFSAPRGHSLWKPLRAKVPIALDAPFIPFPTRRTFGFSVALSLSHRTGGRCVVVAPKGTVIKSPAWVLDIEITAVMRRTDRGKEPPSSEAELGRGQAQLPSQRRVAISAISVDYFDLVN